MRSHLKIVFTILSLQLMTSCNGDGDRPIQSSSFPPVEFGYELVEVIGSPEQTHKVIISQGFHKGGHVEVEFNGYEFYGDANKHYLIRAYEKPSGDISGYIVYARGDDH